MENLTLTKLALISRRAREDSTFQFTSLAHLLNVEFLRGCYRSLGKEKASGIDGRSWHDYGEDLDANLTNLLERLKAKKYKPLPAKRVYIPKNDKETRPLGLPAIEDKIVRKGIARILEAIYEADFMDCSYGIRPAGANRRRYSSRRQPQPHAGQHLFTLCTGLVVCQTSPTPRMRKMLSGPLCR